MVSLSFLRSLPVLLLGSALRDSWASLSPVKPAGWRPHRVPFNRVLPQQGLLVPNWPVGIQGLNGSSWPSTGLGQSQLPFEPGLFCFKLLDLML